MRRPFLPFLGILAIGLFAACDAPPASASPVREDAPAGRAAPLREDAPAADHAPEQESRYRLELQPGLDSLAAEAGVPARGADPALRTRIELQALAARIRDRLLALGATDAVVRLTIAPGAGASRGAEAASGAARISVVRSGIPPRSAAVVTGGEDVLPDAASVFDRACAGSADPARIQGGLEALRREAQARGRYGAEASVDSIVAEAGFARVHVCLRPGPTVTLDTLDLAGGDVRPSVAGAISGLTKGRVLSPAALDEARARLESSGLFASVGALEVAPGAEAGRARVTAPVVPNRLSRFEGAVGLQNGGGLTGLVDLALGNIGGSGRSAGARWAGFGEGRSDYAASFREPALFGGALDASVALEAQVADSLYTRTRWSLELSGRPAAFARASAALRRGGSVYTGAARGSSATWSLEGRFAWQALSPLANPERGLGGSLAIEAGRRSEAYPGYGRSTRGLLRGALALEAARPAGGSRAVYASMRGERVTLGGPLPAEELRFIGGNEGLRGHRDRAYAGNRIFAMTLEHRWLTDARGGRAFLFLDAARHDLDAAVEAGTVRQAAGTSLARTGLSPGWEFGYGAGLQSSVQAGLVRIELGMKPGAPLREGKLHLHFSTSW